MTPGRIKKMFWDGANKRWRFPLECKNLHFIREGGCTDTNRFRQIRHCVARLAVILAAWVVHEC